jgi:flagellar basal body P-ring formation protein FlgA
MKHFSWKLYFAPVAVLLVCFTVSAATEIKLREKVASSSSVVRLGDVAEISGPDGEKQRRLAMLLLMPAPAPGTQRFVRLREVQDVLVAQGEDLGQIRFAGANQIAIESPGATRQAVSGSVVGGALDRRAVLLSGQVQGADAVSAAAPQLDEADVERLRGELNALVMEYVAAKAGQDDSWRVSCTVPERFLELLQTARSEPKCSGGKAPWTGRQRFVVSFTTPKGTVQIPVFAEVGLATQAVVAVRPIERGGVITAAHVQAMTVDSVPTGSDERAPIISVEQLIGMEAREAIKAGEIVLSNQVRAPLLVKRGEEIAVVSRSGRIRVQTYARAVQDGAKGELVQVETLDKKDRYDARVTGTREAVVFTATRPADVQPKLERTETARAK